jgi:hypothetical protein
MNRTVLGLILIGAFVLAGIAGLITLLDILGRLIRL